MKKKKLNERETIVELLSLIYLNGSLEEFISEDGSMAELLKKYPLCPKNFIVALENVAKANIEAEEMFNDLLDLHNILPEEVES